MSNLENLENTNGSQAKMDSNREDFMTIGETISYMCEKLGRISRTSFYRCGYREMLTVRSYGRNKKNGRTAIKLCRKSEVDKIIIAILQNPQLDGLEEEKKESK